MLIQRHWDTWKAWAEINTTLNVQCGQLCETSWTITVCYSRFVSNTFLWLSFWKFIVKSCLCFQTHKALIAAIEVCLSNLAQHCSMDFFSLLALITLGVLTLKMTALLSLPFLPWQLSSANKAQFIKFSSERNCISPSENSLNFLYKSIYVNCVLNTGVYKVILCCLQFKYLLLNQLLPKAHHKCLF